MLFYILVVLVFIVPLMKVYVVDNEYDNGTWVNIYVFNELDLMLLFLPLLILTLLSHFFKRNKKKIYWSLVVSSLFYSIYGILAILTPSMDSYPILGTYLMVLLFPSVLFLIRH